jgi:PAS domain S-box-containing protein
MFLKNQTIVLDVRTILITNLIISVVCSIILAHLWFQYKKRYSGLFLWTMHFVLQTTASVFVLLRGQVSGWISIVLVNLLVMIGFMLLYIGLERFTEKRGTQIHNYIFLLLFTVIHIYFTFFRPNIDIRNINLSIGLLFFSIQILRLIFKRLESSLRNLMMGIGMVFIAYSIINLTRIIYLILFPQSNTDLFSLGNFESLIIFLYMLLLFILSYNLVFAVSKKVFMENIVQEEKFNKAFNLSPNAIIITRKSDGKIIEINERFENITGYSRSEVMGKTTRDLKLWADEKDRIKAVNELSTYKRIVEEEFSFRKKSGKLIQTLYFAELIDIDGEQCILSTAVDITQLKKDEQALKDTKMKLEDTLEDFYTLRLGMSDNLKKTKLDAENRVIRKKLDKLKTSK